MYTVKLVDDISRTVDADKMIIHNEPGNPGPHVNLNKNGETVFFAPFDTVLFIQKK